LAKSANFDTAVVSERNIPQDWSWNIGSATAELQQNALGAAYGIDDTRR
jgi:hypothetical protein